MWHAPAPGTIEVELRMARYEHLMERRPLVVIMHLWAFCPPLTFPAFFAGRPGTHLTSSVGGTSVLLRQNPHNVDEWHKRVILFEGTPSQMVRTYTDAVKTVDPAKATGTWHPDAGAAILNLG
jgi:pre-mRNA-splicing factor SYF1